MAPKYFHIHIQFNIPKKAYTGKKKILLNNFYINNQDYWSSHSFSHLQKLIIFFVIKVTSTRLNIEDYIDYINTEA